MVKVNVANLTKKFGDVVALDDISFETGSGKLMTLLGPSGCGKTTALRCIAGLEKADCGEIYIGEKLLTSIKNKIFVPPEKRNLSMVFQSYAIWPHMTVYKNISFGLEIKKVPRNEIDKKVKEILSLVGLEGVEKRYPAQLSGGQQQRVALARSLILEPSVLLLDEPLSNLDFKLRERMRFDLKELQRRLGITAIHVTHDQTEAMVISDKICLMSAGKIEQIGTAQELYQNPVNKFVADFIGTTNFSAGKVSEILVEDNRCVIECEKGIYIHCPLHKDVRKGDEVLISLRPEHVEINRKKPMGKVNVWEGKVAKMVFLGNFIDYRISIKGIEFRVQSEPSVLFKEKEDVYVKVDPEKCIVITQKRH